MPSTLYYARALRDVAEALCVMLSDRRSRLTYGLGPTGASSNTGGSSVGDAELRTGQTGCGSAGGKFSAPGKER